MARPKLRSPEQPKPVQFLLGVYEALASLKLAVFVIAASAVVLGWATFVESWYGTEAVQFGVYQTWWFAALMALLGVNVLAAALIRFPWKRYQTGFVITHAGILVLLAGCLLSRLGGIDAQMPIFEGRTGHRAFESTQHFELKIEPLGKGRAEATTVHIPFASGPFNWQDYSGDLVRWPWREYSTIYWFPWRLAYRDWGRIYDQHGVQLDVLDYYSDSRRAAARPLKLRVQTVNGDAPAKKTEDAAGASWTTVSLDVQGVDEPQSAHGRMGLGSRESLPDGTRVVFWVAKNQAETEAFLNSGPVGKLGPEGQLVFHAAGKKFPIAVEQFQRQSRQPLGNTGLEVELVRLDPQFLGAVLQVHRQGTSPHRMVLLADFPEFNQQDDEHGVYGEYWVDAAQHPGRGEAAKTDPNSIHHPERPRIDLVQGADRKLYYRTWHSPKLGTVGRVPLGGTKVAAFAKTARPVAFYVEQFTPHDQPGARIEPVPFAKKRDKAFKERRVRLRLSVDGRSEEFWLAGLPADPLGSLPHGDQQRFVFGKDRRVAVTLPWDQIDVGFQLYLHKFQRKLDPGSSQASHYSSLVELRDREGKPVSHGRTSDENRILITLNQPVNFSDPRTGRSYRIYQEAFRGPWKPGDPEFDQLAGGSDSREELFLSWLTVNYDPGRGMKYTGSLMIVAGIATMFYMRAYFFRHSLPKST